MAAQQIGELGPDASAWAVPLLTAALYDDGARSEDWSEWTGTNAGGRIEEVTRAAAAALVCMGPSGVEALRVVLRAGDAEQRSAALAALDDAETATVAQLAPELRHTLDRGPAELRWQALCALALLEPPWLFGWMSDHHDDPEASVRYVVAHHLRWYGDPASPIIRRMLDDESPFVQAMAAESLAAVAPPERTLAELGAILRAGPGPRRGFGRWWAAVRGLAVLGPAAAEVLPLLAEFMPHLSEYHKRELRTVIRRISGEVEPPPNDDE